MILFNSEKNHLAELQRIFLASFHEGFAALFMLRNKKNVLSAKKNLFSYEKNILARVKRIFLALKTKINFSALKRII